jgi:hypothetical protein
MATACYSQLGFGFQPKLVVDFAGGTRSTGRRVFKARVAPLVAKAQARHERRGRPVHIRTSFRHRAKSWPHHRRILVKVDVTAAGLDVRFIVTNRRGRAADLHLVVRRPGDVRELDQGAQARQPRGSPQLPSLPRECLPVAAAQRRVAPAMKRAVARIISGENNVAASL